jgi:uncharacterized protein
VLDVPQAKAAYALLKARALKGLSIGYELLRSTVKSGARHLEQIKLFEISLTALPMNELATISNVKQLEDEDRKLAMELKSMFAAAAKKMV